MMKIINMMIMLLMLLLLLMMMMIEWKRGTRSKKG
jgi:hypothetical protein